MATAKGKITAANMVPGTVVRIIKESDATAELFEREPEWTAARIKRGSTLAEIIENIPVGSGRRKIVTKFGEFVAVGHQTFILAKDGEAAELPETAVQADAISEYAAEHNLSEKAEQDMRTAMAAVQAEALPAERFTLTEEQIEENAAEKLALTVQRDTEMQIEKADEDLAEARALMTAEANRTITEAAKDIENLPHEIRHILNEELNTARIQVGFGEFSNAAFSATRVSEKAEKFTKVLAEIEESGRALAELSLPAVDVAKVKAQIENARSFLTTHSPWEAGRLAKRSAEMWARVVRLRGEFEAAPEWRKERITAALATMGTVVYPEGTPEHTAYREELTEALAAFKAGPVRWRVTFERVGRFSPGVVPAFEYNDSETPDSVSARLRSHLRRYLTSREFSIDFEGERLMIEGGRFGSGTASIIS